MTSFEERIVSELRAEIYAVPRGTPGAVDPRLGRRWPAAVAAATATIVGLGIFMGQLGSGPIAAGDDTEIVLAHAALAVEADPLESPEGELVYVAAPSGPPPNVDVPTLQPEPSLSGVDALDVVDSFFGTKTAPIVLLSGHSGGLYVYEVAATDTIPAVDRVIAALLDQRMLCLGSAGGSACTQVGDVSPHLLTMEVDSTYRIGWIGLSPETSFVTVVGGGIDVALRPLGSSIVVDLDGVAGRAPNQVQLTAFAANGEQLAQETVQIVVEAP